MDRPRDRERLLLASRQGRGGTVGRAHMHEAELVELARADALHLPTLQVAHGADPDGELASEEEVAPEAELVDQREVMVDALDAEAARLGGRPQPHILAEEANPSRGRRVIAGDDLDERRLAGAVVADEADHLTGVDGAIDAPERARRAVVLGDAGQLDDGRCVSRHRASRAEVTAARPRRRRAAT